MIEKREHSQKFPLIKKNKSEFLQVVSFFESIKCTLQKAVRNVSRRK